MKRRKQEKTKRRLADMSLPPEQRGRQDRGSGTRKQGVPAQLSHGRGSKAERHRRDMARKQPRPRKQGRRQQT